MGILVLLGIVIVIFIIVFMTCIRIVPQTKECIVERLGKYNGTLHAGFNTLAPFIDRVVRVVSTKEQVVDFPPQPVITKDNVTMQIDTVIYFQITDSRQYTYGVERPMSAIENLTATTLRNIIGEMELDETLTSRDIINTKMRTELDVATDPWGIKVNRVELKNILPPEDIRNSMERQMKAEREKREIILKAEADKESVVLRANAVKEQKIREAEGEKEAAILRAEAVKQQKIREAEGEAQAILAVQKANAEAIILLKEAGATSEVLALKGMETFGKVADGKATKIIIPSNYQNLASMITTFAELNEKSTDGTEGNK
ncbi:SPFH domain-containing protein [Sebaldella sp. S0638]|uniref:SPFH domain-containing protein n=1 Tax=Sebaldella sp. S0638 TaxID=2957809 RepID=UPI00209EBB42|nr:SPFH domain-containing protein [Sebaldella sp. S0638]MCP1226019.1 SPFH/Band 7/PHB domain protein [Sebaldella sp. S0638]